VSDAVLRVEDLQVYYHTLGDPIKAVDGVSFELWPGERFGLAGESGSGKSTTALALLGLIKPPGQIEGGHIFLDGLDLLSLADDEMRQARLAQISMIPQGAMNSLNPVMRVKNQIIDGIRDHGDNRPRQELEEWVKDLLDRVGLRQEVVDMYPHELSGGMKQRVCIAIAISLRPRVIIADEPTSALDVVVQRQIMETLRRLQDDLGASVILIGHDMGLMAQFVDRLGVMYAGKLMEVTPVKQAFNDPLHPYTRLLIGSLPSLTRKGEFMGIPGLPPSLMDPPSGCPFHPRCPNVMDQCSQQMPQFKEVRSDHWVACHLY
jgi:oligopeptide/dipeptide ABC transporter ATP-binding protein